MSVCAPAPAHAGQLLGRRGVLVSGTVSSTGGNPLSMAQVQLQTSQGDLLQMHVTDSGGGFWFGNVPIGNYEVVISLSGYHTGIWSLQVGYAPVMGLNYSLTPIASSARARKPPGNANVVSVRQLLVPKKAWKEFRKAAESEARGKTDDAIKHWEKSIEIYPQFAESYMRLSQAYANRGDSARAMKDAERAVALDGKRAEPYNYLGYAYVKAGEIPKAEEAFKKAVGISDSDWFGHFWLGKLRYQQHDAKGAYPHLLRASQLRPKIPEICILLYNDLLVLGRKQKALAELDYFLKQFPHDRMAKTVRKTRAILVKSMADESH